MQNLMFGSQPRVGFRFESYGIKKKLYKNKTILCDECVYAVFPPEILRFRFANLCFGFNSVLRSSAEAKSHETTGRKKAI